MFAKKNVSQYLPDGKFVRTYESVSEAAKINHISQAAISVAIKEPHRRAGGHLWRFYEVSELSEKNFAKPKGHKKWTPVSQYTMEGKLVKTYPSLAEAAKATGISYNNIREYSCGKRRPCGGYIWRRYEVKQLPSVEENGSIGKKRSVYQYTMDGEFVAEYDSIRAAARALHVSNQLISATLTGKGKSAGGFLWRYFKVSHLKEDDIPSCTHSGGRRGIPVAQYTLDGKLLNTYPSIESAGRSVWLSPSAISSCLRSLHKTAGGFLWAICSTSESDIQEVTA